MKKSSYQIGLGIAFGTVLALILGSRGIFLTIGIAVGFAVANAIRRRQPASPHSSIGNQRSAKSSQLAAR